MMLGRRCLERNRGPEMGNARERSYAHSSVIEVFALKMVNERKYGFKRFEKCVETTGHSMKLLSQEILNHSIMTQSK